MLFRGHRESLVLTFFFLSFLFGCMFQTVAAFGYEDAIVAKFDRIQQLDVRKHQRLLFSGAVAFGLGQGIIPW